jgi:hypothetical protein
MRSNWMFSEGKVHGGARAALLLGAGLVISCGGPTAPVSALLRIEPTLTVYHPLDIVTVAVRNVGSIGVSVNTCGQTSLQRLDGTNWLNARVFSDTSMLCPDRVTSLPIGSTLVGTAGRLASSAPDGTYRYEVDAITGPDGNRVPPGARFSAPFVVASQ